MGKETISSLALLAYPQSWQSGLLHSRTMPSNQNTGTGTGCQLEHIEKSLGTDSIGYRETHNEDTMKYKLITDSDHYKMGEMKAFYSL